MPSSGKRAASRARYCSRTCGGSVSRMSRRGMGLSGLGQAEQTGGVVEADVRAHLLGNGRAVDEMRRLLGRFERIVGREHQAIGAERIEGADQRLGRTHARGSHHKVVLKILRRRLAELDRIELGPSATVEAPK